MSAGVEELLMRVAKVAGRKLTWWQYDQTSWSAREWMPFALQRLSVQLWTALADEAQRAIGAASRGGRKTQTFVHLPGLISWTEFYQVGRIQ